MSRVVLFDLDELLAFGDFLDQPVQALFTALEDRIGHAVGVQGNGLGRVVVARDDVIDAVGRVVGIDDTHDRDAQGAGLGHGDLVLADVDDEQRSG